MKVKFLFAWYDIWVGVFIDKNKKCAYIFPLPMIGFIIMSKGNYCIWCKQPKETKDMVNHDCCKKCDVPM